MHLMPNLRQVRARQSRSLAVSSQQAMARATSSGVDVSRLVAARVRLRLARMAAKGTQACGARSRHHDGGHFNCAHRRTYTILE